MDSTTCVTHRVLIQLDRVVAELREFEDEEAAGFLEDLANAEDEKFLACDDCPEPGCPVCAQIKPEVE